MSTAFAEMTCAQLSGPQRATVAGSYSKLILQCSICGRGCVTVERPAITAVAFLLT